MADPIIQNLSSQELYLRKAVCKLVNLKTSESIEVKDLRIKFDIKKAVTSHPNEGTIEIYNLNDKVRKFTEIPLGEDKKVSEQGGLYIELSAGYQNFTRQIFTGFASGGAIYESPDWVSKFRVTDGKSPLHAQTFAKTYKAGIPVQSVIKEVLDSFNLPYDFVAPVITSEVVKFGLTLSGTSAKILDKYAEKYKFNWSIQSGAILLVMRGMPIPGNIINLTPKTGLLSRPVRTEKGIEFLSLLIPSLRPGVLVRLDDGRDFKGTCLVNGVQFKGDTHADEFKAYVEGKLL